LIGFEFASGSIVSLLQEIYRVKLQKHGTLDCIQQILK